MFCAVGRLSALRKGVCWRKLLIACQFVISYENRKVSCNQRYIFRCYETILSSIFVPYRYNCWNWGSHSGTIGYTIFRDVTLCSSRDVHRHFGDSYCLHLLGRRCKCTEQATSNKKLLAPYFPSISLILIMEVLCPSETLIYRSTQLHIQRVKNRHQKLLYCYRLRLLSYHSFQRTKRKTNNLRGP
jgi:hypothetical protein